MHESTQGSGIVDNVREMAATVRHAPAETWDAAQHRTKRLATILPDGMGQRVRQFIRHHPGLATVLMLGLALAIRELTGRGRRQSHVAENY